MGHDHAHGHSHGHDHGRSQSRRALTISLAMTVAYGLGQLVTGLLFHSLTLIADAGHNVSDGGSILLALVAAWAAGLPVHGARTYGWRRVEVLAALVNGLLLVAIGIAILYEAATRFSDPPEVHGWGVAIMGFIGIAANGIPVLLMMRASRGRDDINLRGALVHAATDVLGAVGAIIVGVTAHLFGWYIVDPIVAVFIGVIVLFSSWGLIRSSVRILLEIAPEDCDPQEVGAAMAGVEGVVEVHDLHVWTITSGFQAMSAHVLVKPDVDSSRVLAELRRLIEADFGISHTTVQIDDAKSELLEIGTTPRPRPATTATEH